MNRPWVEHTAPLVHYVAHCFNQVPSPLTEASISKLLASLLPYVRCYVHCALHLQELFLRHWHDFAVHLVPTHQEVVLVWLHACARARPQHAQLTLDLERACGGAAVVRAHYCAPQWQSMARRLHDRVWCRARARVLQYLTAYHATQRELVVEQAATAQRAAATAAQHAAEQAAKKRAQQAAERAATVAKYAATAAQMAAHEASYNATAVRLLRQKASQKAAAAAYGATLAATRCADRALQCAQAAREARRQRNAASARAAAAAQAAASHAQDVARRACEAWTFVVRQREARKAIEVLRAAKEMAQRKTFVAGRVAASVAQGAANTAAMAARRAESFATIAASATQAALRLKDEGAEQPVVNVRLRFKGADDDADVAARNRHRQHLLQRDQNTWRKWRRHVLNRYHKTIFVHPLLLMHGLLCRHALDRVPDVPRSRKKPLLQSSWSYPRYQLVHHVPSTTAGVDDSFDMSEPMTALEACATCRDDTHIWLATLHISDAQVSLRTHFVLHFGWKLICQFLPYFAAAHVQTNMAAARWKTKPHRLRRPCAHYELRSLTAPLIAQSIWTPTNRVLYMQQLNRKIEHAVNAACEQALVDLFTT